MFCFRVVENDALGGLDIGPDRLGSVDDKAELLHDIILRDGVPIGMRGEATLGADTGSTQPYW